ncbi:extracellular solute-binding protein [Granulosicoccus antarcticus]|uniref:Putative ABC transporter-binding protein n=1 Tax=Granulosicoccus antarcticus IMCC3135 TaxID=1192854 RepID=A0A2Z2NV70_9GAMM|nr:extracellular solute-binding protein [Granulosicoccus antarcticus]ASJ74405.1 putative ABC transporter-binding protein [Granulosicoccus antarcticus IMCC3135]
MRKIVKTTSLAIVAALAAPAVWAECSPDYTGVEITATTQTGPYIASALQNAAKGWEAKTCGTVKVVEFPLSELYPKIVTTLASGDDAFDVIAFAPAWAPDFTPYLSEMPASYQEGEDWEDIAPVYRESLMVWNGKVLSQTMDGDVHTYSYRIDLFEDEANQAGFKEKYGYDLAIPATWKEYLDIAEYFQTNIDGVWGTAEAFRRGGQQFWFLFSHAAAYTSHPDFPGSMFFDPDTMDAQVNNPGWVKGLEEYIRASQLAPPSALNFSFGEVNAAFAGGQVAQSIGWGDTGVIGADPEQSKVAGSVGSAVLPSAREVYNYKTGEWDEYDDVLNTPFMAFGGWQAAVPQTSKKQDAAWDFISYLSSPEVSGEATVTAGTGVNPYRISHTTNTERWSSIFSEREAREYLGAQQASVTADNVALDMRLPAYFSYTEILEIELSKALAGDVTPQEALDTVAAGWNELTDDLGRDEQLAAYRASMGLD